jgi:peroxiredoxin
MIAMINFHVRSAWLANLPFAPQSRATGPAGGRGLLVLFVTLAALGPVGNRTGHAWETPAAETVGKQRAASPIGRKIAEFSLQDERGKTYTQDDFGDQQLLVFAFLGTECPLAKLYGPRLDRLAQAYAERGVAIVGVIANAHDSFDDLTRYVHELKLAMPVLKDEGNRLADAIGAERTPQVFVLDAERTVRYAGRIDDQYGVGYIRPEPEQHDLQQAIDQLLAGREVAKPLTDAPGCIIARVRQPQPDATITYRQHIAPLLQKRCVECHRAGEVAPFELTQYDEVAGWAETILEVVEDGRMPPWHATSDKVTFANDRRLSPLEKQQLAAWVAAGAPEGDVGEVPPMPKFAEGWQLADEPDLVVNMSDQPYGVPAEGAVAYKYFEVDPKLTEDRWIQAVEVAPGNRAVVHHILVFLRTPDGGLQDDGGGVRGFLAAYVPGMRAVPFPRGMAKFLPAGSQLVFQMHYTPIGSPQEDQSRIGFVFADPATVTHEVHTVSAFQPNLRIAKRTERPHRINQNAADKRRATAHADASHASPRRRIPIPPENTRFGILADAIGCARIRFQLADQLPARRAARFAGRHLREVRSGV